MYMGNTTAAGCSLPHSVQCLSCTALFLPRVRAGSDWHLGYPDCGKDSQSPIDLAADLETMVKVSNMTMHPFMRLFPFLRERHSLMSRKKHVVSFRKPFTARKKLVLCEGSC